MPRLPDGDPAPPNGEIPGSALDGLAGAPFGLYVHVPFCRTRCGYCDFNTYTATDLGAEGHQTDSYVRALLREVRLAQRVLTDDGTRDVPPVDTVFVGGGTPTLLGAEGLRTVLDGIRACFELANGAEVTTEANPDSVDAQSIAALAEAGFTRMSVGMQSSVPHVLRTLERTHNPDNVERAVAGARAAGLQISLDLIYGTPGESIDDWRTSLADAVALGPDHVSAYALTVEPGTKLAAQVRRGEVPPTDDDDEAEKYVVADETLGAAGYGWYEVSNWARDRASRCRHNIGYWGDGNWWGAGPGAHSHVGNLRWWNVKHPTAYANRLASGESPAQARETLTEEQRHDERVLLGARMSDGLPIGALRQRDRAAVAGLVADELVDGTAAVANSRIVLTRRGRLLADTVVRRLLGLNG